MSTTEQVKGQAHNFTQKIRENSPNSRQLIGLVTIISTGILFLTLGGLFLGGSAIATALVTPVLIFFSPILVPLAITLFVVVSGLVISGGTALAAISAGRWLYEYVKGHHPVGADKVDAARIRLADTASHLKERASGYVHGAQESAVQTKDQVADAISS